MDFPTKIALTHPMVDDFFFLFIRKRKKFGTMLGADFHLFFGFC